MRAAWRDYLAQVQQGPRRRPHRPLAGLVRPAPAGRQGDRRQAGGAQAPVSAILLGGNVAVKKGKDVGGDFKHVRACRSATQLGCVIAFSTFDDARGRLALRQAARLDGRPRTEVLCTNPAALGGGTAPSTTIFPSAPFAPGTLIARGSGCWRREPHAATPWVSTPSRVPRRCSSAGGAHVLQLTSQAGAPVPKPSPDDEVGTASHGREHRARRPRRPRRQRGGGVREEEPLTTSDRPRRATRASTCGARGARRW